VLEVRIEIWGVRVYVEADILVDEVRWGYKCTTVLRWLLRFAIYEKSDLFLLSTAFT
jgi:hypothetical protein